MKFVGLNSLVKRLPHYAEDIKKNIKELFSAELEGLSVKQMYGVALTAGYFLKNEQMLNDIRAEAKIHLEEADATAAKTAVILTCMMSTYYGFSSVTKDKELRELPANLYMSAFSAPGVTKIDFELYCLTISIFLKCSECIDDHINKLSSLGISKTAIHNVGRIAAVLRATKAALEIENIRSYEFIARGPIF